MVVLSQQTATALVKYGQAAELPPVHFTSRPYAISPTFIQALTAEEMAQRRQQLKPDGQDAIQVAIPISGAAVGLTFFSTLIDDLSRRSARFRFQVISRVTAYTQTFLAEMATRPCATVDTAATDLAVVEKYERICRDHLLTLEVTKAREQAFKTACRSEHSGGTL